MGFGITCVTYNKWDIVTIRTYTTDFIYFTCTDTGVIVTQSCALLYTTAHCDLLLQWRYCSCDAYCVRYSIVLLQYLSQACWVLCSPRLDFFHRTVISTLVAANRLRSPLPLLPDPTQSYSLQKSLSDTLWLTTSHQKLSKSSSWT